MIDLVVDGLAVFRLAHLVTDDIILDGPRARWVAHWEGQGYPKLAYLPSCTWCTSMWVGFAAVTARRAVPRAWSPLARALAFSAAAGLITERR